MSKFFCLTAALSTALTPFTAEATLSSEYPVAPNLNVNESVCYMQTEDGRTLDLSNLCANPDRNTTATSVQIRQLLETKLCQRCNLRGANLSSSNLIGADLSYANLSNADLRNTNMLGANLNKTDMSNAKLSGAIMPDGTIHK
jgi:uncharacterized protein YjbI with pentapeptide repeats